MSLWCRAVTVFSVLRFQNEGCPPSPQPLWLFLLSPRYLSTLPTLFPPQLRLFLLSFHHHSDSSIHSPPPLRLFLLSSHHHSDPSYSLPTTTPTLPTLSPPPLSFSPHHFSDSSYSLPSTTPTLFPQPLRLFLLTPHHHFDSDLTLTTTNPTLPKFKLLNSGAEKALVYFMNETQNTWIIHFNTTKYYITSRTFNVTYSTE